jgi:hypothetical protein
VNATSKLQKSDYAIQSKVAMALRSCEPTSFVLFGSSVKFSAFALSIFTSGLLSIRKICRQYRNGRAETPKIYRCAGRALAITALGLVRLSVSALRYAAQSQTVHFLSAMPTIPHQN